MSGPTNNEEYNALLIKWGQAEPICEECGTNLTEKDVCCTGLLWVCLCCKLKLPRVPMYRDDRTAERRQMGLTDF